MNQQLQNRFENEQVLHQRNVDLQRKHDDLNRDFRRARTEHQTEMQRQSKELERLYRIKISKRDAIQQAERQQRGELQQKLMSLQTADNSPMAPTTGAGQRRRGACIGDYSPTQTQVQFSFECTPRAPPMIFALCLASCEDVLPPLLQKKSLKSNTPALSVTVLFSSLFLCSANTWKTLSSPPFSVLKFFELVLQHPRWF